MRTKLFGWLILAFVGGANGSEKLNTPVDSSLLNLTRLNYADFVAAIWALKVVGARDDGDYVFWKLPITQALYNVSAELLPLHRQLWRDPAVNKQTKRLSAQLAQCLSKSDRLNLLKELLIEVNSGKVPDYVLLTLLSPGSEWSSWIDRNYKDADVRSVLQSIADEDSGELRANIVLTLDGLGFDFLQEYGVDVAQKLHCAIEDRML